MTTNLAVQRIMVLEDSFLLAMEVKTALEEAGAEVIGPFSNSNAALRSLREDRPDCAVLDVNLGGSASFDLARTLRTRGVPFLFFTGYDRNALPPEFANVQRLEKPVSIVRLLQAIGDCCGAAPAST